MNFSSCLKLPFYRIRNRLTTFVLLMLSITLLSACADTTDPNGIFPDSIDTSDDHKSSEQYESVLEKENIDTAPPTEGMVRSKLTNEWITEDVFSTRPLAVVIPNESAAVPHYNLSRASVLYEANVEGRMSRLLAVFEDWEELEKIGNIRSLRTYYAYWALEWDAFIVHWGGPYFVEEILDKPNVENLNGDSSSDADAFFRSKDRSDPHNAYAGGAGLRELILQKDYSLTNRGLSDESHYQFAAPSSPNTLEQYNDAKTAVTIDMSGCYPLTRCYFEYQKEDGLYYRYQHLSGSSDEPHMDAATGEQLAFKNIIVQNITYEELGEGYLALQCHDTTQDGWFFTQGKGIHITWKKTSDFGATRYYDDDGNEITLNTGKTMVLVVKNDDTFTYY